MSNTTDKDKNINPILVDVCLEEHNKIVIKQQQCRIVLLRHASKCPHEIGTCVVTPICGYMKNLWKHLIGCKDQNCTLNHCLSSRYVLAHYSKCIDTLCPVCQPVREAIQKNFGNKNIDASSNENKSVACCSVAPVNSQVPVSNRTCVDVIDLTDDNDSVTEKKP